MSTHKVDNIQESTPGAGVTVSGLKAGPGSILPLSSVADVADLDTTFTAPSDDMMVPVRNKGYVYRRDNTAGKWRPEGLTRAAGPVISANSKGIVGDGVNDDSVQLALANAAAVASGGRHELDLSSLPTRCYVNSNLTLTAPFHVNPGAALIYVGLGKTLTISGPFEPGLYPVFDPFMPGKVLFTNNISIRHFYAKWWGIGTGTSNDVPRLTFMESCLPDSCTVVFTLGMQMLLNTTWWFNNRSGIRFISEIEPRPNGGGGAPRFFWGGPASVQLTDGAITAGQAVLTSATGGFTAAHVGEWVIVYNAGSPADKPHLKARITGYTDTHTVTLEANATTTQAATRVAVGGIMIYMDRCLHCRIEKFHFEIDDINSVRHPANVAIDLDGYFGGNYGFGSQCWVEGNNFHANHPNKWAEHVRISESVLFNHEYHKIISNQFFSGAFLGHFGGYAHITAGSTAVRTNGNAFFANTGDVLRVRIANAGSTPLVNVDTNNGAVSFVSNVTPLASTMVGKNIIIVGAGVAGADLNTTIAAVFDANHGNLAAPAGTTRLATTATVIAGKLDTTATVIDFSHATLAVAPPVTLDNVDIWVGEGMGSAVKIGGSFNAKKITLAHNQAIGFKNWLTQLNGSVQCIENNVPANECNYFFAEASEPLYIRGDNSETSLQFFDIQCHQPVTAVAIRCDPSSIQPNGGYIRLAQNVPLTLIGGTFDAAIPPGSTIFDLRANGSLILKGTNSANYTMAQCGLDDVTLASNLFGGVVDAVCNQGIVDQPASCWRKGGSTLIGGVLYLSTPVAAPVDANIPPNFMSCYLDEAGNNLKIRIRKSDGTYKTVTIAMV